MICLSSPHSRTDTLNNGTLISNWTSFEMNIFHEFQKLEVELS